MKVKWSKPQIDPKGWNDFYLCYFKHKDINEYIFQVCRFRDEWIFERDIERDYKLLAWSELPQKPEI